MAGLPMILSDAIPGQEEGNVSYVTSHQAGVYAPGPGRVARAVGDWLSKGQDFLRERAEKIGARTLLRFEGESMSFAQVEEGINRLANVLRQHHVQKGDQVVVMLRKISCKMASEVVFSPLK